MREIKTSKHLVKVQGGEDLNIQLVNEHLEDGLDIVKLKITSEVPTNMPMIALSWQESIVDIHSYWHPTSFRNKGLHADWAGGFFSKATISAPVSCLFNVKGENRHTCAYSDALHPVNINIGVHEEDGTFKCQVVLFTEPSKNIQEYEGELRIDTRSLPYHQCLKEVSAWWENMEQYKPAFVPEAAKEPMYSTWYSFHQEITEDEIEKQCSLAKDIGCETVIVDDGWQTTDNNRGYAFCGDWKVAKERIKDMKDHVKRVHAMGLKYILWYSVPFVGLYSEAWHKFKDCLLSYNEHLKAGVLDPRYPEVREYLISTYENAVKEWDLDGLKLDFVDEFDLPRMGDDKYNEKMDFESVQEAVHCLLSTIMETLRNIKPDFMIEFRQRYIGPYMRQYGNMFRVTDCPNDTITNRIGSMDIRLLCGNTAAHADPLMWNVQDTIENVALQFINTLFAVPQLSMKIDALTETHFKTCKFWLNFWKEHRDVLLQGELTPFHPELNYPLIISSTLKECLIAVYSDFIVPLSLEENKKVILVNGTFNNKIYVDVHDNYNERQLEVLNCSGEVIITKTITLNKGITVIEIPPCGVAYLI